MHKHRNWKILTTFNKPKCHFGQTQITFYGYRFDQDGLKPTPEKVQAIYECEPPRSKSEVRSFLGMAGYLSKFIPRYASLTKPLRDVIRTETKFQWGPTEHKAFKEVKGAITSKDTIAFFNPKLPIMEVWKLVIMRDYQQVSSSDLLRVGSQYISLAGH